MQQGQGFVGGSFSAAESAVADRGAFIVRTYLHLVGAVFAFVFLEAALLLSGLAEPIIMTLFGHPAGFLLTIVLFIGSGFFARHFARQSESPVTAYLALGVYVVAEAIIFLPLLAFASMYDVSAIPTAGLVTLVLFGGLTGIVFLTRHDFSFLRNFLWIGTLGALATAIAGVLFGFSLGVFFSGAMVVLAGGWILYQTSMVLHHYRTDQHVAAALELFADLALLFWYVLRIFLAARR